MGGWEGGGEGAGSLLISWLGCVLTYDVSLSLSLSLSQLSPLLSLPPILPPALSLIHLESGEAQVGHKPQRRRASSVQRAPSPAPRGNPASAATATTNTPSLIQAPTHFSEKARPNSRGRVHQRPRKRMPTFGAQQSLGGADDSDVLGGGQERTHDAQA